MRLYLDTEFNGHGGDLISMALTSAPLPPHPMLSHAGPSPTWWYQAVLFKGPVNSWVAEHVMPVLDAAPLMPALFKQSFHDFISRFKNPEIVCDWHADAEHFCRMLAGNDYGSSLDFACTITILNTPSGAIISSTPHNALADATALMNWHELKLAA